MAAEYVVGLEQKKPYEFVQIEVFMEKEDALDYAGKYANGHGYIRISRNRWRSGHDDQQWLIIWKR